jgi:pyridoxine 5-phosphate synthase
MIALSVNVNKIALLRNSRSGNYPDVASYARTCIAAGADGITVHPRPDQRHIRPEDVRVLAQVTSSSGVEFNIEGNPFAEPREDYPGLLSLVDTARPHQCTLVPDQSSQLTSDHGFDLQTEGALLAPVIAVLKSLKVRVSLFMDPDIRQIELAGKLGADRIELYTGPYAAAWYNHKAVADVCRQYEQAARYAIDIGLGVNAGHDLNLANLPNFAITPGLQEVSIGHALIVDAINMGLENAVKAYKTILERATTE